MHETWQRFADDPWTIFAGLVCAGLALGWWGLRSDRRRYAAGGIALLLLAAGLVVAAYFTESPRKSAEAFVHRLAEQGQRRDSAAIAAALDDEYRFENRTKASLTAAITRELQNYRPDYVRATVQRIEANATNAEVDVEFATGGAYASGGLQVHAPRYFVQLRLTLVKRGSEWKIREIRRYEPGSDPPREMGLEERWRIVIDN